MAVTIVTRLVTELPDITGVKAMDAMLGSNDDNPARVRHMRIALNANNMAMRIVLNANNMAMRGACKYSPNWHLLHSI